MTRRGEAARAGPHDAGMGDKYMQNPRRSRDKAVDVTKYKPAPLPTPSTAAIGAQSRPATPRLRPVKQPGLRQPGYGRIGRR